MLRFLDAFFLVFHSLLIGFNLTGWIWRRVRRVHLIVISLTLLSWVGLGVFYGLGYCPSTDWHWEVKRRLGETNLPASYVKYYVDRVAGVNSDPLVVDVAVAVLGVGAFALSVVLNLRDRRSLNAGVKTEADTRIGSGPIYPGPAD